MNKVIVLLIGLHSFLSFSCENIIIKNKQAVFENDIKDILCELTSKSFNELLDIKIEILDIRKSPLLRKFAKEKISFLSFYRPGVSPLNHKYYIGFNPLKLERNKLTNFEMTAVLAHELAHTLQWKEMKTDIHRMFSSLLMGLDFDKKKQFESTADKIAIKKGLDSQTSYTEGLISYRQNNLRNTENGEDKDYLLRLYNFSEALRQIEYELSSESNIDTSRHRAKY